MNQVNSPESLRLGVLLVEDDASLRDWWCGSLEEMGYSVLSAGSAPEALKIARQPVTPIDLAVLDLGLPPHPNLQVISQTATPPNWLAVQLAQCGTVWVTPDSASMVFEALTSGADVGVFDFPVNPRSRVGWTIARLAEAQRVTRFVSWCASGKLHPNRHPLAEADRSARWILEWLKKKN